MKSTNSTVVVEFNIGLINTPTRTFDADRYEMDEENGWLNVFNEKRMVASLRLSSVKSVYLDSRYEFNSTGKE